MVKRSVNKSAKIHALIEGNRNITVNEIVEQFKKEKMTVSRPLIYKALGRARAGGDASKTNRNKPGPKPGSTRAKAATTATSSNDDLFAAMQNFVNAAGSLEKAIEILSVFKR